MTNTSSAIVFFGTDEFSLATLSSLLKAGYPVAAVVTKPDSKQGRGQKITPPPVKALASRHGVNVWQPSKLRDIKPDILKLDKPIGVLSSYGKIIPQSTIDLFDPGIINIHPSLLPKYRGPTPIETAIANGDKKTGVSVMQLSAGMDAGPVYVAKEHLLTCKETKLELYSTLAKAGADLLLEALPRIIDGSLIPQPQNDNEATYTHLLTKDDAWLKVDTLTAAQAERRVRAHLGFPKTKTTLKGHDVIITKAHVTNSQQTAMDVRCQDDNYLAIDEVIAPSGRRMSASDFERGYLRRLE